MTTRFAVITDAHYGPQPMYKSCNRIMSEESGRVITEIVAELNSHPEIAFVAQLGDLVQDNWKAPSRSEDLQSLRSALALLAPLNAPIYHSVGNHCRTTLSVQDLAAAFSYERLYYRFETPEHSFVTLYSESAPDGISVSQEQIDWLGNELAQSGKHVIVFLHHPLLEFSLEDNFWFKGTPEKAFVKNGEAVHAILRNSGRVRGVFNGHLHQNHFMERDGIPYFTIQSMVEDITVTCRPAETRAYVSVDDRSISVEILGLDKMRYAYQYNR